MPMTFRFRLVPFVAALVVAVAGVLLGQWQTRRAVEKETIEATLSVREAVAPITLDARPRPTDELEFRRVIVDGEFARDWTVYLDNRPYKGAAGFQVLTPMKIAGSDMHVLVARGWFKRDAADRAKLPVIAAPAGAIRIEGAARRGSGHLLQLGKAEPLRPGVIVQNADVAEFAQASGLHLLPFVVEQLSDTRDGLVRDWPRPSSGAGKHRGYAFQWYALAATALIFFAATGLRRETKRP
jgi:surfeit locus 1 family protein